MPACTESSASQVSCFRLGSRMHKGPLTRPRLTVAELAGLLLISKSGFESLGDPNGSSSDFLEGSSAGNLRCNQQRSRTRVRNDSAIAPEATMVKSSAHRPVILLWLGSENARKSAARCCTVFLISLVSAFAEICQRTASKQRINNSCSSGSSEVQTRLPSPHFRWSSGRSVGSLHSNSGVEGTGGIDRSSHPQGEKRDYPSGPLLDSPRDHLEAVQLRNQFRRSKA